MIRNRLLPSLGKGVEVTGSLPGTFKGINGDPSSLNNGGRTGPNRSASSSFRLEAGVALNLCQANNYRTMLVLQNYDVAEKLFWNLGAPAFDGSGFLVPGGNFLFDVNCPTDSLWVFATVNLSGFYMESAPIGV